jgi:hypothetical protein
MSGDGEVSLGEVVTTLLFGHARRTILCFGNRRQDNLIDTESQVLEIWRQQPGQRVAGARGQGPAVDLLERDLARLAAD